MGAGIRRADLVDADVVDQVELGSDGTTSIFSGVSVVSTNSSLKQIVFSGIYIIHGDIDERLEAGDILVLSATGGADGTYHVAAIVDDTTVQVVESIPDSTGGQAAAYYPPGAKKVGFDPSHCANVSAHNVQAAIEDLDIAVGGTVTTQVILNILGGIVYVGDGEFVLKA